VKGLLDKLQVPPLNENRGPQNPAKRRPRTRRTRWSYHGNSDPWFSPLDTFEYYKNMSTANGGPEAASKWSQFYFVPGMSHCGGGTSLDQFDMLSAMVDWVEKGVVPVSVIATGKAFPGRSRPLCPYPRHAQYKGQGDTEDAKNFECR